jgi:fatty acid desaturase
MKLNIASRKLIAWLVGLICLLAVTALVVFKAPDSVIGFAPWFITGLIFLTAIFVGGVIWSDFIKSKWWRPELANTIDMIWPKKKEIKEPYEIQKLDPMTFPEAKPLQENNQEGGGK